jgi:hypothetical protein
MGVSSRQNCCRKLRVDKGIDDLKGIEEVDSH